MIKVDGSVICENCGKKHDLKLVGTDYLHEWYCPRCRHFNRENSLILDKSEKQVVVFRVGT